MKGTKLETRQRIADVVDKAIQIGVQKHIEETTGVEYRNGGVSFLRIQAINELEQIAGVEVETQYGEAHLTAATDPQTTEHEE